MRHLPELGAMISTPNLPTPTTFSDRRLLRVCGIFITWQVIKSTRSGAGTFSRASRSTPKWSMGTRQSEMWETLLTWDPRTWWNHSSSARRSNTFTFSLPTNRCAQLNIIKHWSNSRLSHFWTCQKTKFKTGVQRVIGNKFYGLQEYLTTTAFKLAILALAA